MTLRQSLRQYRVPLVISLLLLAGLYQNIVPDMVRQWYEDENYSHGFLVPLVTVYFLHQKRRELLEVEVERCHDVVARHRRLDNPLRGFAAVTVEGDFVFTVPPDQHAVEGQLQTLAAFRLRPEDLAILNNPISVPARPSGVANDLPGQTFVRINPRINRLEGKPGWQIFL